MSEQTDLSGSYESTGENRPLKVCIVGGLQIIRRGVELLLESNGMSVVGFFETDQALAEALESKTSQFDVALAILTPSGPFQSFHNIKELLAATEQAIPLAVLSDKASRGQIYAALQTGAKAYVNSNADPEELIKAIRMAAEGKVYLAPEAAQLLANDISKSATEPNGSARLPSVALSRRETEIVQLLCEGLSSKKVAKRLHISPKTVENHRYNIYRKCEVNSIAALIRYAIQNGMVAF